MADASEQIYFIRIVVLGDAGVGKTCLLNRYVGNCFAVETEPSFPDLITVKTSVDGYDAKLYIFESVGNEKFNCYTDINCRNANAAIVCVDPTNFDSYLKMKYWIEEINSDNLNNECKLYICCTKSDLIDSDGDRYAIEAIDLRAKMNCTKLFVTSSKNGNGIDDMFQQIVRDMIKTSEYDCVSSYEVQNLPELSQSAPDYTEKHTWKQWFSGKRRRYSFFH